MAQLPTEESSNERTYAGMMAVARDVVPRTMKSRPDPANYTVLAEDLTMSTSNVGQVALDFESDELASEKRRRLLDNFWKNNYVISVAFMLIFIGYYPVSAVQSSLNNEKGLGMTALSAKYAAMAFGNLFTNNYVVDRFGCKWTMSIGMLMYSSYIAANFYPTVFMLVPFGILSGVGGAAMWMAQGTYMTRIANDYVAACNAGGGNKEGRQLLTAEGQSAELSRIKSRVFAIFNFLYFASNAMGNVASSLILPLAGSANMTDQARLEYCGAAYCNENLDDIAAADAAFRAQNSTKTSLLLRNVLTSSGVHRLLAATVAVSAATPTPLASPTKPDAANVYYLCTFCVTSALCGVLILIFFLDRLPSLGVSETVTNSDSIFKLVMATVRHWGNPYQLLIIPLGLYNGMDATFWSAEFTKAFVTCSVGIHYVGYVMVCYGLSSPVFIFVFSWFNKSRFRFIPYLIGLAAQLSVAIAMLRWTPTDSGDLAALFALSVIWGIGSGVWYPSTYAFISIMFRENMEAAFSNFHLWNNLGASINYAWSFELCVATKIKLLMGFVVVGVVGHLIVEMHSYLVSRRSGAKEAAAVAVAVAAAAAAATVDEGDKRSQVDIQYGSVIQLTTKTGK